MYDSCELSENSEKSRREEGSRKDKGEGRKGGEGEGGGEVDGGSNEHLLGGVLQWHWFYKTKHEVIRGVSRLHFVDKYKNDQKIIQINKG